MKKSILQIGTALKRAELKQINGGFNCQTAGDCADQYNLTAFDPLPDSAFICQSGICRFA